MGVGVCVRARAFVRVCVPVIRHWGYILGLIRVGEVWPLRQTSTSEPCYAPPRTRQGKLERGTVRQMDEPSL